MLDTLTVHIVEGALFIREDPLMNWGGGSGKSGKKKTQQSLT